MGPKSGKNWLFGCHSALKNIREGLIYTTLIMKTTWGVGDTDLTHSMYFCKPDAIATT